MLAPRIGLLGALLCALAAPCLAQQEEVPGPPHETNLTVGEAPPSRFSLESIDGRAHDLADAAGRPILLLFFRGTW